MRSFYLAFIVFALGIFSFYYPVLVFVLPFLFLFERRVYIIFLFLVGVFSAIFSFSVDRNYMLSSLIFLNKQLHLQVTIDSVKLSKDNYIYTAKETKLGGIRFSSEKLFFPGDIVSVSGVLKKPKSFKVAKNKEFNYPYYLKTRGIYSMFDVKSIEKIGQSNSLLFKAKKGLFSLKLKLLDFYRSKLKTDTFALVSGIVLGEKGFFDKLSLEYFKKSSLMHLIVFSGFNIMIGCIVIFYLSRVLFGFYAPIFTIVFAFSLVALVGFDPPSLRALFMASVSFIFMQFGYQASAEKALILIGGLLLFFNPKYIFDPSFILSFLATFSLMQTNWFFEEKIFFLPSFLRETISSTISATLATAPYLVYFSGFFSLFGIVANVFASFLATAILIVGMYLPVLSIFSSVFFSFLELASDMLYKIAYLFGGESRIVYFSISSFALLVIYFLYFLFVLILRFLPRKA